MSIPVVLADAQIELFGKISRTSENLRKLSSAKLTLGAIDSRLQNLETNWVKFNNQDDKLFPHRAELSKHAYYTQDIAFLAEEAYLTNKAVILDLLRTVQAKDGAPTAPATDSSVTGPRTTLPRIQLPHFSGRYEDWPAFRDLFKSIIERDTATPKVEKLHYLRTCLKGEAELLIRDLAMTGDNYDRAWKSLTDYYKNKRLLVRLYLGAFLALPKLKGESAAELRKTYHGIKATVSSLKSIDRPITSSKDLFVHLSIELLDARSRRKWENTICSSTNPPSYDTLERFLEQRLHMLEAMLPIKLETTPSGGTTAKSTRNHVAKKHDGKADAPKRSRCSLCKGDHILMLCDNYRGKSAVDRKQHVDAENLCVNCLGRHKIVECMSKKNCSVCGNCHHSSLHDACRESKTTKTVLVAQKQIDLTTKVLLATAQVRVTNEHGESSLVRALIDQGSESSMITERLAQRLKLKRSSTSVSIFGVGRKKTGVARGLVSLNISARFGGASLNVSALILPRLTIYDVGVEIVRKPWSHIHGLALADSYYGSAEPIEILLGAKVYAEILEFGLRKGDEHEPVAQKTTLGWSLSGAVGPKDINQHILTHQCRVDNALLDLVQRFWAQEEMPSVTVASKSDLECEEHFTRTHAREPNGRYVVQLHLLTPLPDLSATRRSAVRLLKTMENKFEKDHEFRALYVDFMRQYLNLGHMTGLPLQRIPSEPASFLITE